MDEEVDENDNEVLRERKIRMGAKLKRMDSPARSRTSSVLYDSDDSIENMQLTG